MVVNDYAGLLVKRGALGYIASKLAPTICTCDQRLKRIDRSTAFTSLVIAPIEM
ncbi:hypothetical protein PS938_01209 [Pseudomonas fluorescens]|uniref:Uncharacterized protein n=1 Tax=Pseudomonas fluorescens TaxID=294 RepID=A0A5E7SMP4_PSEFL|nr:hypothetical protein PS938_01209 [Pseudomonas fluorescens]